MYPDVQLYIDGQWRASRDGRTLPVIDPATGQSLGTVAHASIPDLDEALAAAERGFATWRATSAYDRYKIMQKAAQLLRERVDSIARIMTQEQGKPLAEARMETQSAADIIDWLAEEGRRSYGRLVPSRNPSIEQKVIKEPVGPVAAFTPWNFPINQVVRKLSSALAAGCSIIIKAPEETPASPAELIRAFADAGVPAGVIGLVYGVPAEISNYLIPHPVIRKVTFTGSTPVGKQLAALAGQHMKRATMELGGHAPALVFDDADLDLAARVLSTAKFRNAGQVCVSPTRILVQRKVFEAFTEKFVGLTREVRVGNGLEAGITMGPVANERRIPALVDLIEDAVGAGAKLETGGKAVEGGRLFLRADRVERPDPGNAHHERRTFRPCCVAGAVRHSGRGDSRVQPRAVRSCLLCLHHFDEDRPGTEQWYRSRHAVDQPSGYRLAGSPVWRDQGLGLRLRRRYRSHRGLPQYQAGDAVQLS